MWLISYSNGSLVLLYSLKLFLWCLFNQRLRVLLSTIWSSISLSFSLLNMGDTLAVNIRYISFMGKSILLIYNLCICLSWWHFTTSLLNLLQVLTTWAIWDRNSFANISNSRLSSIIFLLMNNVEHFFVVCVHGLYFSVWSSVFTISV